MTQKIATIPPIERWLMMKVIVLILKLNSVYLIGVKLVPTKVTTI